MQGDQVVFSTGTDEHGSKVEKAANGKDVKEYCNKISSSFKNLFTCLGTSHDVFVRTTDDRHKQTVQALWQRLVNGGYLVQGEHEGWYCQSDEAFLTDQQVGENPDGKRVSLESGHAVEWLKEANYLFQLPKFTDRILEWLDTTAVYPPARSNEIKGFLSAHDIRDLSVSRPSDRVPWAIPVPGDASQSVYVWLDALTNYLTVAGIQVSPDPTVPVHWGFDKVVHVVGKDILRFHTLYWPSFLMAAGIDPPNRVIVHAHWTVNKVKMSKSLGNVMCPVELLKKYELDAVRYTLLRNGGLVDDADFSEDSLKSRRKDELANTYGNLLSRSTANRIMPQTKWPDVQNIEDIPLVKNHVRPLPGVVDAYYQDFEFSKGIEAVVHLLYESNRVFTEEEPWVLIKQLKRNPENQEELQLKLNSIMYSMLESLRVSSLLLLPIIPDTCNKVLDSLGVSSEERSFKDATHPKNYSGTEFKRLATPLFPILE